ncbi:M4 family metallopeptidase [Kitasatospora sp. NPDC059463]|uniref:M4 family metallopeptidase n=1 Tax=unclassified Kitasatospora TaxID=2633591 RepID=UPI00368A1C4A
MHHRSRSPKLLGTAIAAVLGLGLGMPTASAVPSADPDPVPGLVAGSDTAAPQLVTGLAEAAPGATPADAARAHLAAHRDRYQVDPAQLVETGTERAADGRRTVRFAQQYGGLPVFGAAYLVHLVGEGEGQRVESVGGKYFTGLAAPTAQSVPDAVLRELALGAVEDPVARQAATAEDHGLVVLPGGTGRLARHFTVRGADAAAGEAKARAVFVDATVGAVALAYEVRAPQLPAAQAAGSAGAAGAPEPAVGTAPDVHGNPVQVNIGRLPDGSYQLTDLTRPATITTYDAEGREYLEVRGRMPAGVQPAASATPDFPASAAATGAANAHINAGLVYDFYRDRLGRQGIDGQNGPIIAMVNATSFGKPMRNAAWDGQKMIYGSGGAKEFPFAVAIDVAGHEMTHGVVEKTAGLIMIGQSGALDEAVSDYFGNAIEVTARGLSMDDPRAALLGESLCRTGTPEACADRRLDDGRTTVADYVGAPYSVDSGGAHLNSTIMGGALWDIRRTLDPLTADRLVYRALSEYLTPLDGFVEARNAVLAAGRSMGLSRAQLRSVAGAFDAHGIKEGWQRRIGVDSRLVLGDVAGGLVAPAVADGRWVAATTGHGFGGVLGVVAGTVGSSAEPVRLSPDDGRSHAWPATDGTTAAWTTLGGLPGGGWGAEVLARPLDGGPLRSVYTGPNQQVSDVQVSGGTIAFRLADFATHRALPAISVNGGPVVQIPLADGHAASSVTLQGGLLGWTEIWTSGERTVFAPTVYSIATGRVVAQYVLGDGEGAPAVRAEQTRLAGDRLYWVEQPDDKSTGSSIRSGAVDGSGVSEVLTGTTADLRRIESFTVSDKAVTFVHAFEEPNGPVHNADLPKLWQLPLAGGTPRRVSCNRGGQYVPAADRGTRVLWLDATAGRTDLVVRERPTGTC